MSSNYIKIPPRADFDVSDQVYEWFRALSNELIRLRQQDESSEALNSLLAQIKKLQDQFNFLNGEVLDPEVLANKLNNIVKDIIQRESSIDTTELLNAKISRLERKVAVLEEEVTSNGGDAFLAIAKAFTP